MAFVMALLAGVQAAQAQGEAVDFEQQIRPLLIEHCSKCHGPKTQKAGLRLDVRSAAFHGGDNGPVIVPGRPNDSELVRRVVSTDPDLQMPPAAERARLTEPQASLIVRWIASGARWEETDYDRNAARDSRLDHWAWQPIPVVEPPAKNERSEGAPNSTVGNPIDRFVAAKLAENGLTMSPEADRRTLIRRLSFDLLGLPPTPEAVEEFQNDPDPDACAKLVDRFLDSPQYGERQARHWLDIAHYADTHGFERDQRRDNAWRYRDWVIRAFNTDLPYNQFLQDQIAGDVLRPEDPAAVEATGFLAAGPWDFVGQQETPSPVLKRLARADDLDDMVTQVMTAACGVTINCARCHDHKLDPISQREYYSLTAVFAGVKRAERIVSTAEEQEIAGRKAELETQLSEVRTAIAKLRGDGWSLTDVIGGGDGRGSGTAGSGIDPLTGNVQVAARGFLQETTVNAYRDSPLPFVDGVVVPSGGADVGVPVTSTGLIVRGLPETSGQAWDAVRNGPVHSTYSTTLGGIDFAVEPHTLLGLHANAAVTFELQAMRANGLPGHLRFRSSVGYFGQTPRNGASLHVLLDGNVVFERLRIGRDDGLIEIDLPIPDSVQFLTLMATDGGNGIGHDQIGFGDALLAPADKATEGSAVSTALQTLTNRLTELKQAIADLPAPARIYAVVAETPPEVRVHRRGSPEDPGDVVVPAALSCVDGLNSDFGTTELTDGQRRIALANWITDPANPLTRRAIVNRLWQHHFGRGIVETPGDLGLGGGMPTHPDLLDWLAAELLQNDWSLKSIERLICTSAVYRQSSLRSESEPGAEALAVDSENHLLWRQNPRRLDAESFRDAVLTVTGKLNQTMYGPGYRDFEYKEEYAPVYTYLTADKPELWRRTIYRFTVRTTPDPFMTTLDCPNAANLTPTRSVTTTALQSLALLNNEFILRQSGYFAERIAADDPGNVRGQVKLAFQLAFGRWPTDNEATAAIQLIRQQGASEFCRMLFNASEFSYVD